MKWPDKNIIEKERRTHKELRQETEEHKINQTIIVGSLKKVPYLLMTFTFYPITNYNAGRKKNDDLLQGSIIFCKRHSDLELIASTLESLIIFL